MSDFRLRVDAEFGVFLGTSYSEEVTFDVPLFHGTYGDLLLLLLHKGLQTRYLLGSPLQQTFLSILYNVSPFLKELGIQSVMGIFQLISFYSSPRWLLHDQDSFISLKLVLDSVMNVLTYKYEANAVLVFALLRQSKRYLDLSDRKLSDLLVKAEPRAEEAKGGKSEEEKKEPAWLPTEQWFEDNKAQLPLKAILGLLAHVSQKLEQAYLVYDATEAAVFKLLRRTSLIGVQEDILKFSFLHYATNPAIENWLSGYLWKIVYLKNSHLSLFVPGRVRYVEVRSKGTGNVSARTEESKGVEEKRIATEEAGKK